MKVLRCVACAAAVVLAASVAYAGPILIVNGAAGTSEPGTTAAITSNLSTLHTAVGNTVTVSDGIPADLSPYSQVWDIRFSNVFALTVPQQNQYLGYLQSGGGMFLMGENSSFMSRNTSIFDFIGLTGGGAIGPNLVGGCDGLQNVIAPFTGPNPVTSISWACSGVVGSLGTGDWITERADLSGGSGIAWGVGDLANASAGALTVVFDVNFMQGNYGVNEQNLTKNLISYVGGQVEPTIPEPGSMMLLGSGLIGLAGMVRRRLRR